MCQRLFSLQTPRHPSCIERLCGQHNLEAAKENKGNAEDFGQNATRNHLRFWTLDTADHALRERPAWAEHSQVRATVLTGLPRKCLDSLVPRVLVAALKISLPSPLHQSASIALFHQGVNLLAHKNTVV
jgi:hypothetical protein